MKIPRLGRSLSAAALFALALPAIARAQDVRPDAGTHTVKRGDTLWDIAQAYLGDAYLWPEIYRLNTDQIDDPHWIYPGEVLKLPGRAGAAPAVAEGAPPQVEAPRRGQQPTVFSPRTIARGPYGGANANVLPPRVPVGDVIRAPYLDRENGPRTSGRIIFGRDIPGIAMPRTSTNFALFDRVLMEPPAGSLAAEHDRFIAYRLGEDLEGTGTIVIPSAVLEVVRPAQHGEAAIVRVMELFTQLNGEDRVIPLDTVGTGATGVPVAVAPGQLRSTTILAIHRPSELASLGYFVLFDLSTRDGTRVGDEIEIYREREPQDEGLAIPEIPIGKGQVVRVTPYGATALVTWQEQPSIKKGEHVRITARMP